MTDGTTRREFLGSMAAFSLFPFEQEKPDLILHNGHIVTMNPADPVAEAVAISRGRFFAVGKNADVMNLGAPVVRKMDLGGKTVLPGFRICAWWIAISAPSPRFKWQCASGLQKRQPASGSSVSSTTTQKRKTAVRSASPTWTRLFPIIPYTSNIAAATPSTPILLRCERRESTRKHRILRAGKLITIRPQED